MPLNKSWYSAEGLVTLLSLFIHCANPRSDAIRIRKGSVGPFYQRSLQISCFVFVSTWILKVPYLFSGSPPPHGISFGSLSFFTLVDLILLYVLDQLCWLMHPCLSVNQLVCCWAVLEPLAVFLSFDFEFLCCTHTYHCHCSFLHNLTFGLSHNSQLSLVLEVSLSCLISWSTFA